jgi:hypothetical protein
MKKQFILFFGMILLFATAVFIQPDIRSASVDQDVGISYTITDQNTPVVNVSDVNLAPAVVYLGDSYVYSKQVSADSYTHADWSDQVNIYNNFQADYGLAEITNIEHQYTSRQTLTSTNQNNKWQFRLDIGEAMNYKFVC